MENLDRSPILWFDLPEKVKYKKEVVMKVIHTMPNMVGKLPVELQCDPDIIDKASKNQHPEFNAVTAMYDTLNIAAKRDPIVCEILVKNDPRVFPYLKQYNEKIVRQGVSYNGEYLQYAPKKYITREVVMMAVKQNGMALQYAGKEFCDDEEIVKAAVSNCGWAIHSASARLAQNQAMIDTALDTSPELSKYGFKRSTNIK